MYVCMYAMHFKLPVVRGMCIYSRRFVRILLCIVLLIIMTYLWLSTIQHIKCIVHLNRTFSDDMLY